MANSIILKKSSVSAKAPLTTDLDFGELAINYADGKLYYKKSNGTTIDYFLSASNSVTSFNGRTGAITLTSTDVPSLDMSKITTGNLLTDRLAEPSYKIGTVTLTAKPLFDVLRGDRTAFLPADQIIIEASTDAGVTWYDLGISDSNKRKLFTGQRPVISIPLKNGVKSTDCMIRITITGMKYNVPAGTPETSRYDYWNSTYVTTTERYFAPTDGWSWVNSNSDRLYFKVERATGAASTTWILDREGYMSGWSGGNGFTLSGSTFGGGTNQTANSWNWRITFRTCSPTYTFNDADLATTYTNSQQSVYHIKLTGQNVWSYSNNMMYYDHLYGWDEYQNMVLPSGITIAGTSYFNGNVVFNGTSTFNNTISLTKPITSTNDLNADGSNFVVNTTTKSTALYAYDVRRSGTTVGGFKLDGSLLHTGITLTEGTNVDQVTTITKSLTLTTDWQDVGINTTNLATGTYVVQLYANDVGAGGSNSSEYYSGVMSWYSGDTNSALEMPTDEIVLHRAGASGEGALYLRTYRTLTADPNNLKLQIYSNTANASAANYVFKFRRMI